MAFRDSSKLIQSDELLSIELYSAVENNDANSAREMLNLRPDVSLQLEGGRNLLHLAVEKYSSKAKENIIDLFLASDLFTLDLYLKLDEKNITPIDFAHSKSTELYAKMVSRVEQLTDNPSAFVNTSHPKTSPSNGKREMSVDHNQNEVRSTNATTTSTHQSVSLVLQQEEQRTTLERSYLKSIYSATAWDNIKHLPDLIESYLIDADKALEKIDEKLEKQMAVHEDNLQHFKPLLLAALSEVIGTFDVNVDNVEFNLINRCCTVFRKLKLSIEEDVDLTALYRKFANPSVSILVLENDRLILIKDKFVLDGRDASSQNIGDVIKYLLRRDSICFENIKLADDYLEYIGSTIIPKLFSVQLTENEFNLAVGNCKKLIAKFPESLVEKKNSIINDINLVIEARKNSLQSKKSSDLIPQQRNQNELPSNATKKFSVANSEIKENGKRMGCHYDSVLKLYRDAGAVLFDRANKLAPKAPSKMQPENNSPFGLPKSYKMDI